MKKDAIQTAADVIKGADGLLIAAGAGMGVDSGLPDYRGGEGFWTAYPLFAECGIRYEDILNGGAFLSDPRLAWGFAAHVLALYARTEPHEGFAILKRWGDAMPAGAFVFTSNVDRQFQKAGFDPDRIVECHGSIHHLQCSTPCCRDIWPMGEIDLDVDASTLRAVGELPSCPRCGALARPNSLMFSDLWWVHDRTTKQKIRFNVWMDRIRDKKLAIVECGAGTAIVTVRMTCEQYLNWTDARLIRINLRDATGPAGALLFPARANETLQAIDRAM